MDRGKSLVFVIGAGASTELGPFPYAAFLATQIRERLDRFFQGGLADIARRVDIHKWEGLRFIEALSPLTDSIVQTANSARALIPNYDSIDDFIGDWPDESEMVRVSKLAIADVINLAEQESELTQLQSNFDAAQQVFVRLHESWPNIIYRRAGVELRRRDVADRFNNIGFVIFNYDRCIEQFFYYALRYRGQRQPAVAAEILRSIPMLHVYGSLGDFPAAEDDFGTPFGVQKVSLRNLAQGIRTYSEDIREGTTLKAVQELIKHAKKIVFLGFGFHSQNLKVLFGEEPRPSGQRVWATVKGMPQYRVEEIRRQFTDEIGPTLLPKGCQEFMADHWEEIFR